MEDVYRITKNLFKASEFLRFNSSLMHFSPEGIKRDLCDPHRFCKYAVHYLLI